jgi:predicted RNA-binding protein with RPS1 domain
MASKLSISIRKTNTEQESSYQLRFERIKELSGFFQNMLQFVIAAALKKKKKKKKTKKGNHSFYFVML